MSYRNIVVNTVDPRNATDWTARRVMQELQSDPTGEVFTVHLADACETDANADPGLIGSAVKALRNMGHCITTTKARHLSWYTLHTDPDAVGDHHQRMAEEAYSERVSWVRSMAAAALDPNASPSLQAVYDEGISQAIGLGRILGRRTSEVVADCEPLIEV